LKKYEIYEGIYVPEYQPAVFIERMDTLVLADLHLGIEGALEKQGVFLPLSVSLKLVEKIEELVEYVKPKRVIFLGDVKHEFGFPNPSEWINVKKLLQFLLDNNLLVEVVRGNHDNYLISILKRYGIPLHQDVLSCGEISFTHGHLEVKVENLGEIIIMGHEHPSLRLRDEVGVSHKFKCFLVGRVGEKVLIVLPSANELATGTDVNLTSREDFLSPILRKVDIKEFQPFPICIGKEIEKFPKLKYLLL